MCYNGRALVVAGCVGAVEAAKDQLGICRWNYTMKSVEQHAKNKLGSMTRSNKLSSHNCNNSSLISSRAEEAVQSREESLKKVMYLNCWGPN